MNIYDQHVHSNFSPDSKQNLEEYFIKAKQDKDDYFAITDHMDLASHTANGQDVIPDFIAQQQILAKLGKQYGLQPIFGVEAGWRKDFQPRLEQIIKQTPFDLVLLSVHESATTDVGHADFYYGRNVDEAYAEYLQLIYDAITDFQDYDILAHVDYVLRYAGQTNLEFHRPMLTEIFKKVIRQGKAIELNTRMISAYNTLYYTQFFIDLSLSLGGDKFSLASDCHRIAGQKAHFDTVQRLLIEKGVQRISAFRQRKEFFIPLQCKK